MGFPWQNQAETVTAFTDSDWAGCVRTAKSTSGGIIMMGAHVVKTYSRQQRTVALSSAEAELYAMVAASAECLAINAYMRDLGLETKGEVYTDSSAALGISQRAGIGKVRHLRTQGLWVQEARVSGRLAYRKVLGTKNPADVLTKHVDGNLLEKHLQSIGAHIVDGRAEKAPELNSVESEVIWIEDEFVHVTGIGDVMRGKVKRKVQFSDVIKFRAIPSVGNARAIHRKRIGARWQGARSAGGDVDDAPVDNLEECHPEGTGLDVSVVPRALGLAANVSRVGACIGFSSGLCSAVEVAAKAATTSMTSRTRGLFINYKEAS